MPVLLFNGCCAEELVALFVITKLWEALDCCFCPGVARPLETKAFDAPTKVMPCWLAFGEASD